MKVGALQKENLILKRAVQIQNSKLQERAATEAEMLQLRHMTAAFQEQVGQGLPCKVVWGLGRVGAECWDLRFGSKKASLLTLMG